MRSMATLERPKVAVWQHNCSPKAEALNPEDGPLAPNRSGKISTTLHVQRKGRKRWPGCRVVAWTAGTCLFC